ncbi:NAD-dependent epimerase/dehydratase family protein [Planctomycetota bacterium]
MGTKYLLTGGAGFIGSHLAEELLHRGHQVHVIDDLSTGNMDNIKHLKSNPDFSYTIDTIENEPLMAELVDGCDVIYHLAAAVGVFLIVESPVRTIETNIHGTEVVLQMANKKKKKVFIFSTSECYGKNTNEKFSEDMDMVFGNTTMGRWAYACSKAIDEFLALSYWKEKKLPVVVLRLFNTVGPRQVGHYGMVVPRFVQRALAGKDLKVFGDGKQSRCFAHVKDVIQAIADLDQKPEAIGSVINIGNDQEISIEDLANMVIAKINPELKIRYVPYSEAYEEGFEDMRRRVPDLSNIRKLIGYQPKYDIDMILDDVIEHIRSG